MPLQTKNEIRISLTIDTFVGFEVFTAVVMKSIIFWDMKSCSPLSVNRRFGGTYRLHLQGRRNKLGKKPTSKQGAATCLFAGSCWNYFFDPEDGGDMFLKNLGCNSTDYTVSHPRRWYASYHVTKFYLIQFERCNVTQTVNKLSGPNSNTILREGTPKVSVCLFIRYKAINRVYKHILRRSKFVTDQSV
jgi:hypothetical protein